MRRSAIPLFLLLLACGKTERPFEEVRFLMDTVVRISLYNGNRKEFKTRAADAYALMARLEALTSSHIDSSDISRINRFSGGDPGEADSSVLRIVENGLRIGRLSMGAFDITIGAVKRLWHFDSDSGAIPSKQALRSALALVDIQSVRIEKNRIFLDRRGMEIDLGGIAKGYIVDQAVELLQKQGIRSGIVEAGGDLRIFGEHPGNPNWRIGIRHPRIPDGQILAVLNTQAAAIATSGDYERYFFRDGVRYHHLLDPATGMPAAGCISVTAIASTAMDADAWATAIFILGPEKGMKLVEDNPDLEAVIVIEEEGKCRVLTSTGLKSSIELIS